MTIVLPLLSARRRGHLYQVTLVVPKSAPQQLAVGTQSYKCKFVRINYVKINLLSTPHFCPGESLINNNNKTRQASESINSSRGHAITNEIQQMSTWITLIQSTPLAIHLHLQLQLQILVPHLPILFVSVPCSSLPLAAATSNSTSLSIFVLVGDFCVNL